jgi:hypothetical protein
MAAIAISPIVTPKKSLFQTVLNSFNETSLPWKQFKRTKFHKMQANSYPKVRTYKCHPFYGGRVFAGLGLEGTVIPIITNLSQR